MDQLNTTIVHLNKVLASLLDQQIPKQERLDEKRRQKFVQEKKKKKNHNGKTRRQGGRGFVTAE